MIEPKHAHKNRARFSSLFSTSESSQSPVDKQEHKDFERCLHARRRKRTLIRSSAVCPAVKTRAGARAKGKGRGGRAVPFDSFFGSIVCEVASLVPRSRRGRKNGRLMSVICVVRFFHGENSSKVPIIQRKSGNYLR